MWQVPVASAAAAGVLVGLAAVLWPLRDADPVAVLAAASLSGALGLIAGIAQSAVFLPLGALARRLSATPKGRDRLFAALLAVFASPIFVWMAFTAFSGRFARTLPYRGWLIVAVALLLSGGCLITVRLVVAAKAALALAPAGRRDSVRRVLGAAACLGLAFAALAVDRTFLVRRYEFAHIALEVVAFLLTQAGLVVAATSLGPARAVPLGRGPRVAGVAAGCVLLAGAAAVVWYLRRPDDHGLRARFEARGPVATRLLDLSRAFQPRPAALVPARTFAPPVRVAAPEVEVSRLDEVALTNADVVLITVDALRADHLGAYGYARPTSPQIDALAARSVLFERAYTPSPHTSFSIASLLTGRHAFSLARLGRLEGLPTVADAFRAAGYRTIGIFPPAVFYVERERFRWHEARRYGFESLHYDYIEEGKDAVVRTDLAIRLLQQAKGRPVFLWVHYFGPHEPYVHHPELGEAPFGRREIDRYDEEILRVDGEIGRLLAYLAGTRPRTIVAITADHGEEFGEHGGAYHGTTLFDEQARVPLVLHVPGRNGVRIPHPVSTVDVLPTLLGLVGLGWSVPTDGTDLGPWLEGEAVEAAPPPAFAEVDNQKMIVKGGLKLICDSVRDFCRLYDLVADPQERIDLAPKRAQEVAALREELQIWVRRPAGNTPAAPDSPDTEHASLITRAQRFDGEAIRRLGDLLAAGNEQAPPALEERLGAAKLIARSPQQVHADALARAVAGDPDDNVRLWAAIALGRLGDRRALPLIESAPLTEADAETIAYRALALTVLAHPAGPPALVQALPTVDDVHLRCRMLSALGQSRHPSALQALSTAYQHIRSRLCASRALGELRSPEAFAFIAERLPKETYTTVRAALARALGSTGTEAAIPILQDLFRNEQEETVVAAAARALSELGAAQPLKGRRRVHAPPDARELWLVAPDVNGVPLRVRIPAGRRALVKTEVDTAVRRDAYAVALPAESSGRPLHVLPPASYALFR
jgi:arylsulfatase A-like enzyme